MKPLTEVVRDMRVLANEWANSSAPIYPTLTALAAAITDHLARLEALADQWQHKSYAIDAAEMGQGSVADLAEQDEAQTLLACADELRAFIAVRPEPTELERGLRRMAEGFLGTIAERNALLLQAADALAHEHRVALNALAAMREAVRDNDAAEATMQRVARELSEFVSPDDQASAFLPIEAQDVRRLVGMLGGGDG